MTPRKKISSYEEIDKIEITRRWNKHKTAQMARGVSSGGIRRREYNQGFLDGVEYEQTKPIPDHSTWPLEMKFLRLVNELEIHPAAVQMLLADLPNAVARMKAIIDTPLHGEDNGR